MRRVAILKIVPVVLLAGCAVIGAPRGGPAADELHARQALGGEWTLAADESAAGPSAWFRYPTQVVQPRLPDTAVNPDPPDPDLRGVSDKQRQLAYRTEVERWATRNRARDDHYFGIADRLHAVVRALQIEVRTMSVRIVRDGVDVGYRADGRKRSSRFGSVDVEVKTWWEGASLHQELTGTHDFKARQVFRPSADGTSLFVVFRVLSPDFKPPAETTRVYRRTSTGGP